MFKPPMHRRELHERCPSRTTRSTPHTFHTCTQTNVSRERCCRAHVVTSALKMTRSTPIPSTLARRREVHERVVALMLLPVP
eukprot:355261-Chlamydomonas_euryale.AAC.5